MLPSFQTQRLILKEVTEADIPSYTKYFVDYDIIRHLSASVPWPYPKNGVGDWLKATVFPNQGKDKWVWGIFLKENPAELIGVVDLWREGKPENRGFWLGKPFWGKGYMTEAVHPIMDYAFDHLDFEKLVFSNAVQNSRSGRVKEKTGATWVRKEPFKFVDPTLTEHDIYELTKEKWQLFKVSSHEL